MSACVTAASSAKRESARRAAARIAGSGCCRASMATAALRSGPGVARITLSRKAAASAAVARSIRSVSARAAASDSAKRPRRR